MRSKGVAMENSLEKMFNIPLLNTFQKLVIIGSSLTELHQFIQMTLLWTFMSASTIREAKEEMKLSLDIERKRYDNVVMQQTAANTSTDSYKQEVEVI